MRTRRSFLTTAVLGAALAALAPVLPFGIGRSLRIERRGSVYLVDGWVLTAADVRALRDHVL